MFGSKEARTLLVNAVTHERCLLSGHSRRLLLQQVMKVFDFVDKYFTSLLFNENSVSDPRNLIVIKAYDSDTQKSFNEKITAFQTHSKGDLPLPIRSVLTCCVYLWGFQNKNLLR